MLDQREQALRQRERELADQRRILAEEYRLLRARATAPAQAGLGSSPQAIRLQVQQPLRAPAAPQASLWQRIKRVLLGATSPAME